MIDEVMVMMDGVEWSGGGDDDDGVEVVVMMME